VLIALGAAATVAPAGAQDFDPKGRKKGKGGQTKPPTGGGGAKPPAGGGAKPPAGGGAKPPTGGGGAKPPAGGGGAKPPVDPPPDKGPAPAAKKGDAVAIERYTRIALAQPGSPFPLQRLAQLYRDRDGNIVNMVKDFEARVAATPAADAYGPLVALGGVYKIDGRTDDAIKTYERAIAQKASDPTALLALARLLQDRADVPGARARYEQALALQTNNSDREQTLRTLMTLALDAKDWSGAKGFHDKLVAMSKGSLFVKGELGRELATRGEFEQAEREFKELVNAAQGDNRALGPALKELGRAQAKAGKSADALATLKRALAAAGSEAAVRTEIYQLIAEVYRKDQKLAILVKEIEAERPSDFARLMLLGGLYEETGDAKKALETYRKALASNPRHLDLRLKVVRILQSQGEIDKAITEYEALVRAAPHNPTFVFELTEALLQRGDRARALKVLTEVEARASNDEEVLSRLAEFYGRIGEGERSVKVLGRLAQLNTGDPSHLVDLGDRYFQDGNTAMALQTWRRILVVVQPRAKALLALGEVYLEHDMIEEALSTLREAVSLDKDNVAIKKQLAAVLERTKAFGQALVLWQEIAQKARDTNDRMLLRESRSRMVTLWSLEKTLASRIEPLKTKFAAKPPDVESGRLLAEVQVHLRNLPEAEATLTRVIELAPGDAESHLALERVLVQQSKLAEAIVVLEKLVVVEPKRAREVYQRMADYALQIRKDDDAIKYAARAVELNPDDAEGHHRLGDRYLGRGDSEKAIAAYRNAITKNDRLFTVYFKLADLLLAKGATDEADRLFRRVLRGAPDDELVARAARQDMQIHVSADTLESLEQELLPLSIANPQRPLFRRLLVEVYGTLSFDLVRRSNGPASADRDKAKQALAAMGSRAIKPLLDALSDANVAQQRIAIDVLAHVENKNAGPSLFAFATGGGDTQLRTRAMLACGNLRDPAMLGRYESLLFPKDSDQGVATDQVAVAASFGVAKMGHKSALPALRKLTRSGSPEMRAFGLLGVAALKDKAAIKDVAAVAREPGTNPLVRAAAAVALGELKSETESALLLQLASDADAASDPLTRRSALVALTKLDSMQRDPRAEQLFAQALLEPLGQSPRARAASAGVRQAGALGLARWSRGVTPPLAAEDLLPMPESPLDFQGVLLGLGATRASAVDRNVALITSLPAIARVSTSAAATSVDRALTLLDALGEQGLAFEPLLSANEATPEAKAQLRALQESLEPALLPLVQYPNGQVRARALTFLAHSDRDAAHKAIETAMTDPDETVVRLALGALVESGRVASGQVTADRRAAWVNTVAQIARAHPSWGVRSLAVEVLGQANAGAARDTAVRTLAEVAERDAFALVREGALRKLLPLDRQAARKVAATLATRDAEPRVRDVARSMLAPP
jgi:tetratricopeptide (TPR) repeat protein